MAVAFHVGIPSVGVIYNGRLPFRVLIKGHNAASSTPAGKGSVGNPFPPRFRRQHTTGDQVGNPGFVAGLALEDFLE